MTLSDWLPKAALHDGKSLQRMTLLSPIFYISCFAEDDIDLLVAQLEKLNEQEQDDDVIITFDLIFGFYSFHSIFFHYRVVKIFQNIQKNRFVQQYKVNYMQHVN